MQDDEQVCSAPPRDGRALRQFDKAVTRARVADVKPCLPQQFAHFLGEQQHILFLLPPAFHVAGITSAVTGIDDDVLHRAPARVARRSEKRVDGGREVDVAQVR